MSKRQLLPVLVSALLTSTAARADIDLIAIGTISGAYEDLSVETAGKLENGVAGNRLGGLGRSVGPCG